MLAVPAPGTGAGWLPLQAVDASTVVNAPAAAKAVAAFCLTVAAGVTIGYYYGDRVDRAVEVSMSNPLVSVIYGVMAYGLVFFVIGYLSSQVASYGLGSPLLWSAVSVAVVLGVLGLCGYGFVVVGTWVARTVGTRDPWLGLVGVGGVGALAWLLLPPFAAIAVWFGIAAIGIGGPTRLWIHEDVSERTD
ncbi:MAG: hypothetical protein ABEJ05_12730 [Haloglomus sp.]